jgi:hypothetical protein
MQRTLLAVALAALAATAVAVGGVGAAPLSAPSAEAQPQDNPTVDDYEFAVVDHDDWLADRDVDARTVAELLLADAETGDELRALFETGEPLAMDVYGSLADDADAAHVVVTPAPGIDRSAPSEQHPRVEATVDLGDRSVDLVGASDARDAEADAVTLNASEVAVTESVTVEHGSGDSVTVQTDDAVVREDATVLVSDDTVTVDVADVEGVEAVQTIEVTEIPETDVERDAGFDGHSDDEADDGSDDRGRSDA